ncbi:hypothetical protein HK096_011120, partial [Nowakowskiella sp. JEL0078]
NKLQALNEHLQNQISTKHTIFPSFGRAVYFEFQLSNPFALEKNFAISWDDDELRIIQDESEWRYLRRIANLPPTPIERSLFSERQDGTLDLFMNPNETLSIPFVFQSLLPGITAKSPTQLNEESIQPRVISVSFLNTRNNPIAILEIRVCPRGFTVANSIRLFSPENDMIRKSISVNIPISNTEKTEVSHNDISIHQWQKKEYSKTSLTKNDDNDSRNSSLSSKNSVIESSAHQYSSKRNFSTVVFDVAHPTKKYVRCTDDLVVCTLIEKNQV